MKNKTLPKQLFTIREFKKRTLSSSDLDKLCMLDKAVLKNLAKSTSNDILNIGVGIKSDSVTNTHLVLFY